ncbi:MAG: efflux RND transporter periplasmic adaptor subunit, partial [bacterium]
NHMKKIDRRIVIIGTFIFIVVLAYGIMKFLIAQKDAPPSRPSVEAKRNVEAEPVKYETRNSTVTGSGRLSSSSNIDIVAEASGRIIGSEMPLKKGSQFQKGDVLFTVYPDEAALALKSRKSQFLTMLANLLPDIAIDFPEYEQRFRSFFNSVDIEKNLPPLPEYNSEKLKIFLTSRDILSEYYGIQKDELQLSRHTVYAPFDGTYTEVNVEAGSYINTGGRVARAIQTDFLELEIPLKKSDAQWVNPGDKVIVQSDERSSEWEGEVIRKGKFVDPDTQSQAIFIGIRNKSADPLLPGEYLNAEFPGHPVKNVIEIPRNAVFNTDEVFIVRKKRLEKRTIDIVKVNEKTFLIKNLQEGDTLVTEPLINVRAGTKVEVINSES